MASSSIWVTVLLLAFVESSVYFYGPSIELLTRGSAPPNISTSVLDAVKSYRAANKILKLANYPPTYNVLVPLVPGKSFVNRDDAIKYFGYLHHGTFLVEAPKNHGIIASFQVLRLNTGEDKDSVDCIDFIQFSEVTGDLETTASIGQKSQKICGEDDVDDFNPKPSRLIGPAAFVAASGYMLVTVFIFSTRMQTVWRHSRAEVAQNSGKHTLVDGPSHRLLERLMAMEITFTAFPILDKILKEAPIETVKKFQEERIGTLETGPQILACPFQDVYNQVMNKTVHLKLCPSKNASSVYCIHEALFCDYSIQCAFDFDSSVFAADEIGCNGGDGELNKISLNVDEDPGLANFTFVNGSRVLPKKFLGVQKGAGYNVAKAVVIGLGVLFGGVVALSIWHGLKSMTPWVACRKHRNLAVTLKEEGLEFETLRVAEGIKERKGGRSHSI